MLREAQGIFEELGEKSSVAEVRREIGEVLLAAGEVEPAREALAAAVASYREVGLESSYHYLLAETSLARVEEQLGDLAQASERSIQALALARSLQLAGDESNRNIRECLEILERLAQLTPP